jgi:hypothetical protein
MQPQTDIFFKDVTPDLIRGPDGPYKDDRCVTCMTAFGDVLSLWMPDQVRHDKKQLSAKINKLFGASEKLIFITRF